MRNINNAQAIQYELWYVCRLCGKSIRELAKKYGGSGKYYPFVFEQHLKIEHGLSSTEYFCKVLERPNCECGICSQPSVVTKQSKDFVWKRFICGRNPGILKWSEEAKISRVGSGNPMYQKTPWNEGLTKDSSESMMKVSEARTGIIISDKTKKKMSESAKKRLVHGHTGLTHSDETKEKNRQATLSRIKNGQFQQTKTKPHVQLGMILSELDLSYEEECVVGSWSFDYYLPQYEVYIECDGDYFHSNPKIYPNGPKTNTQRINWYRDIKKNEFCKKEGLVLLRFWECDILNNPNEIKEKILCKLKELSQ